MLEAVGLSYEPDLILVWFSMNDVSTLFEPNEDGAPVVPEIGWYRVASKTIDACVRSIGRTIHTRRYTKDLNGVDVAVTGIPFDQATSARP